MGSIMEYVLTDENGNRLIIVSHLDPQSLFESECGFRSFSQFPDGDEDSEPPKVLHYFKKMLLDEKFQDSFEIAKDLYQRYVDQLYYSKPCKCKSKSPYKLCGCVVQLKWMSSAEFKEDDLAILEEILDTEMRLLLYTYICWLSDPTIEIKEEDQDKLIEIGETDRAASIRYQSAGE